MGWLQKGKERETSFTPTQNWVVGVILKKGGGAKRFKPGSRGALDFFPYDFFFNMIFFLENFSYVKGGGRNYH